MSREDYKRGYVFGYEFVKYEGGSERRVFSELKYRGIPFRTPYGIGFRQGAKDCESGKPCKYTLD